MPIYTVERRDGKYKMPDACKDSWAVTLPSSLNLCYHEDGTAWLTAPTRKELIQALRAMVGVMVLVRTELATPH